VLAQEHGLTRITQTREADIEQGETTEMGAKHAIPYGLYRGFGHFSAPLASRTGVKPEDLEMFWQAFTSMFEHDRSAARGEVTLRGLYVFTHADKFGSAAAQDLFSRITITSPGDQPPRSFGDYKIEVDTSDLPDGTALNRIAG
jgi:CRISPR-associated protein Csd2